VTVDRTRLDTLLERSLGHAPPYELHPLAGQASTRRYYRLALEAEPRSLILMQLPADAFASDEGPREAGETKTAEELPFLVVADFLERRGIRVPKVHGHDLPLVLLEDLGDESFEARLLTKPPATWTSDYEAAVDLLARMHDRCADAEGIVKERRFDEELLRWELEHFREWGLEAPYGAAGRELDVHFDVLAATLAAAPTGFVHRDYQSRNLHWKEGELVVIDFQDAMRGPLPYDLVALLCDSYVPLSAELQDAMVARYCEARGLELAAFRPLFDLQVAQRKLKDAGRFVYIDRVRGNPGFLHHFGQSMRYVGRATAAHPALAPIHAHLLAQVPGFPDAVSNPPPQTGVDAP